MFGFPKYIRFHPRVIVNLPNLQQSLSLGKNPFDNAEPCYPQNNIAGSHLCDECGRSSVPIVGHMLMSIWWLLEQVCSLTKECQVPIRVRYKHLKNIDEHTSDSSPTDSRSFFLNWWSSMQGLETLHSCSVFLFASSQYVSTHFSQPFLREAFPILEKFQLVDQKLVIDFFQCPFTLSAS